VVVDDDDEEVEDPDPQPAIVAAAAIRRGRHRGTAGDRRPAVRSERFLTAARLGGKDA
jgi:hypothetical protein